jgi:hypothetical protein
VKLVKMLLVIVAAVLIASPCYATYQFFPANACTGGGNALDGIDCDGGAGPPSWEACADGDAGFVVTSGQDVCIYVMDDDAACGGDSAETPCPLSIQPDDRSDAAANQCWMLVSVSAEAFTSLPSATPQIIYRDSDATAGDANCRSFVNCTDVGDGTEDCDWTLECQVAGTPTNMIVVDADGSNIDFSGAIRLVTDSDGRAISAAEAYGIMHVATGAGTWTLPDVCDSATGANICLYSTTAVNVVIDCQGEDAFTYEGTTESDGEALDSDDDAGEFICVVCLEANEWYVLEHSSGWTGE